MQSLRHDNILTEIVRILDDKDHLVMREPILTQFGEEGARNFKLDIVVKFKNSSHIYVLDVGVAWETSDYTLPEVEKLKRNLYSPIKSEVFDLVRRAGVILPEESPYMCYIRVWKFFVKNSGHKPKEKGISNDKQVTQGPRKARERV
jgi:hypothetical protein